MRPTVVQKLFPAFLALVLIIIVPSTVFCSGSSPPKITFKNHTTKAIFITAANCHTSYYTNGGVPVKLSAGQSFSDDYGGCFDASIDGRGGQCNSPRFSSRHTQGTFKLYAEQCGWEPNKDAWADIYWGIDGGGNVTIHIQDVSDIVGY